MRQKKCKRRRRLARYLYAGNLNVWQNVEPPKWRIFAHKKWQERKPVYKDFEKRLKRW